MPQERRIDVLGTGGLVLDHMLIHSLLQRRGNLRTSFGDNTVVDHENEVHLDLVHGHQRLDSQKNFGAEEFLHRLPCQAADRVQTLCGVQRPERVSEDGGSGAVLAPDPASHPRVGRYGRREVLNDCRSQRRGQHRLIEPRRSGAGKRALVDLGADPEIVSNLFRSQRQHRHERLVEFMVNDCGDR